MRLSLQKNEISGFHFFFACVIILENREEGFL